jgi:hypothetical protein
MSKRRQLRIAVPIDPDIEKARLGLSDAMERYSGPGYDAVFYALEAAFAAIVSVNAAIYDARRRTPIAARKHAFGHR